MSGPTRITFFIEPTEPRDSEPVFLQHGDDQPVERVWSIDGELHALKGIRFDGDCQFEISILSGIESPKLFRLDRYTKFRDGLVPATGSLAGDDIDAKGVSAAGNNNG